MATHYTFHAKRGQCIWDCIRTYQSNTCCKRFLRNKCLGRTQYKISSAWIYCLSHLNWTFCMATGETIKPPTGAKCNTCPEQTHGCGCLCFQTRSCFLFTSKLKSGCSSSHFTSSAKMMTQSNCRGMKIIQFLVLLSCFFPLSNTMIEPPCNFNHIVHELQCATSDTCKTNPAKRF